MPVAFVGTLLGTMEHQRKRIILFLYVELQSYGRNSKQFNNMNILKTAFLRLLRRADYITAPLFIQERNQISSPFAKNGNTLEFDKLMRQQHCHARSINDSKKSREVCANRARLFLFCKPKNRNQATGTFSRGVIVGLRHLSVCILTDTCWEPIRLEEGSHLL